MSVKNPYIQLILISICALYSAYFVEYIMQINGCPLCIYQRFPYLLLIFIAISAIAGKNHKLHNRYIIVTIIVALILAGYHTGIERGWWELSNLCKPLVSLKDNISVHDFKKLLYTQKVSMCNKPALTIFGLSLTEWNLGLNFILLIFCINYRNFQSAN